MMDQSNISKNQIIRNAGLNPHNIYNKFSRGNIYFSEAERILNQLGYQIEIKPKNIKKIN